MKQFQSEELFTIYKYDDLEFGIISTNKKALQKTVDKLNEENQKMNETLINLYEVLSLANALEQIKEVVDERAYGKGYDSANNEC